MDSLQQRIDKLKHDIKQVSEQQHMSLVDLLNQSNESLSQEMRIIRDTLSLLMYVEYVLHGAR